MSQGNNNPPRQEGILHALLERSREWTAGIWAIMMFGLVMVCGMVTLIILFILTLAFGM